MKRMLLLAWLVGALGWLLVLDVAPVHAQAQMAQEPQIERIDVRGMFRVEEEAIRQASGAGPGDAITSRVLGDMIRGVYDLGFFEDVQIDATRGASGVVLTITVEEKPAVCGVRFDGNRRVKDSDLEGLITIPVGSILDESRLRAGERRILEEYRSKGFFLARARASTEPCDEGRVTVVFTMEEEERVRVAAVRFVGNRALDDRQILSAMETRPYSLISLVTPLGNFERDKLSIDLQRIRLLYFERGFLDVGVGDPVVELSRDRTRVYITIPIDEGDAYTVASVAVSGDIEPVTTPEDLMRLVTTQTETTFNYGTIRNDVDRITRFFKDQGYAFVNVNMYPEQDRDTLRVDVSYDIERGPEATIGRIDIVGNTLTRDRVIRRELDVREGTRYRITDIENSRRYVLRLGFFSEVTIREEVDRNDPTRVNLQVMVEERPTGSFQVGAGFSSYESFLAQASIAHNNLFGRGQSLQFSAIVSSLRTLFVLSFNEPRLFDSRWQLGLSLFSRQEAYRDFDRRSAGFGVNVGYQLTRELSLGLGYQLEDVSVRAGGRRGLRQVRFAPLLQGGLTSSVNSVLTWDSRDDRIMPSEGMYQQLRLELADSSIGSYNEFFRLRHTARLFFSPLWRGWVFKLNGELGYIGSMSQQKPVPIFERFFVGGATSVRGFERLSLSPTRPVGRSFDPEATTFAYPVGGDKQLIFNAELEFPLLNALSLRGVVFADAGNAFDNGVPFSLVPDITRAPDNRDGNLLRTSVGFGIRWWSPIGPLRFEWGFPLAPMEGERPMVFEFSILETF